jgi:hypothetical protein
MISYDTIISDDASGRLVDYTYGSKLKYKGKFRIITKNCILWGCHRSQYLRRDKKKQLKIHHSQKEENNFGKTLLVLKTYAMVMGIILLPNFWTMKELTLI